MPEFPLSDVSALAITKNHDDGCSLVCSLLLQPPRIIISNRKSSDVRSFITDISFKNIDLRAWSFSAFSHPNPLLKVNKHNGPKGDRMVDVRVLEENKKTFVKGTTVGRDCNCTA